MYAPFWKRPYQQQVTMDKNNNNNKNNCNNKTAIWMREIPRQSNPSETTTINNHQQPLLSVIHGLAGQCCVCRIFAIIQRHSRNLIFHNGVSSTGQVGNDSFCRRRRRRLYIIGSIQLPREIWKSEMRANQNQRETNHQKKKKKKNITQEFIIMDIPTSCIIVLVIIPNHNTFLLLDMATCTKAVSPIKNPCDDNKS